MRVLFFHETTSPSGGGANRHVHDILPKLRQRGISVALVHCRDTPSRFSGTGYIFDELKEVRPLSQKGTSRLHAILDDFRPDLVQIHRSSNFFIDPLIEKISPVFRFIHYHFPYCSGGKMTWKFPLSACHQAHGNSCLLSHFLRGCGSANPLLNLWRHKKTTEFLGVLRNLTALQTMSEEIVNNLIRNGIEKEKIHLLPAPAPAPTHRPHAKPATGRRSVLHVGGMTSRKGIWVAIRTLRALPDDCDLVLAGDGNELSSVESHIRRRGLGDRVRIYPAPSPEEWGLLYHQADLVILPCLWNEPTGLAAMRATAYAKPIIAFCTNGIKDWLKDGINGTLIPMEKRNLFPSKVGEMMRNPAELRKMGDNARKLWQENHRMDSHIDALLHCYQSVLEK